VKRSGSFPISKSSTWCPSALSIADASDCRVSIPAVPLVARLRPGMYFVDGNVPYEEKNDGPMVTGARRVPFVAPMVSTGSVWVGTKTASSL
jgi:hypothetical protein